jgi:chemotaxis signal transduction protein/DNA-binding transcriptional regulator YiaG
MRLCWVAAGDADDIEYESRNMSRIRYHAQVSTDGQILLHARRRAGLSQRRLAELAGTSQAMVARVERGRQSPSLCTLRRLLAACGANLQVQVDGEAIDEPGVIGPREPVLPGRLLLVEIGAERLAIPVGMVREVLAAVEPRALPGQPPAMLGVAVVRGEPVPCIDLAALLGIPAAGATRGVVLEARDGPLMALVSDADDVRDVAAEQVLDIPPGWTRCEAVNQLARLGVELVPIVNANRLTLDGAAQEHGRAPHSRLLT